MDEIVCYAGTSDIHADTFAQALGAKVSNSLVPSQWAFFVGVHPNLKKIVEDCRKKKIKTAAYWIGSDSLCAMQDVNYRSQIPEFDKHFAVHERIQKELSQES